MKKGKWRNGETGKWEEEREKRGKGEEGIDFEE